MLIRATAAVLLMAGPNVWASPLEDAKAAAQRRDYATYLQIVRPLAAQGNAIAQQWLGSDYQLGVGVAKDYAEALKWYRLSAEQGNALGEFNVGSVYAGGAEGIAKDPVEAVRWYRMAAVQGTDVAQCSLGEMYHQGQGLKRDLVRAYMRLSLCRSSAYAHDFISLDTVAKSMTQEQLATAQQMARECRDRKFRNCE